MNTRNFYQAFSTLYEALKEPLHIQEKGKFYLLLFKDVYPPDDVVFFDNDTVRRITSGGSTIHMRAMKQMHTHEGFEAFRQSIAQNCFSFLDDDGDILRQLFQIYKNAACIPADIKRKLENSITDCTEYQVSRAIAGILICLNYADYLNSRGKSSFIDIEFMRLESDKPLPRHPRYITDSPDAAVAELIGREDELKELNASVIAGDGKLLISAVGGLGKTELVKRFLDILRKTKISECELEAIAWVPYSNEDIRLSLKQALRLQCELDDVWSIVQDKASEYEKRLLLVVDNIEATGNDVYLRKLSSLPCRILVTSRQRNISGFTNVLHLQPLKMVDCRLLFYRHYQFENRDNEILNDIIELTAKLTIMIVFIAKVACLEEISLRELYGKLVEKGFKLSEEDVSCEHEKMQDDNTIIRQMCILFSLVNYSNEDKTILTCISVIPNLQFNFSKAKKWFGVRKNSSLLKLFNVGMLEHITKDRTHIYWMHSVIAAAVREQQKQNLYQLSRPFVSILTEELNTGPVFGREYEKAYLIPFSWSVADIMESHWSTEDDTDFLSSLFHICFACSNYSLCERLIDTVIDVQRNEKNFTCLDLAYSYRNKIDLLLQFDRAADAAILLDEVQELLKSNNVPEDEGDIFNIQCGILYQIRGDFQRSRNYFQKCIDMAERSTDSTKNKDIATAYSNMARMLVDSGDFFEAYEYIKKAIEAQQGDDSDSDLIICYSTLGSICTELMNAGHGIYYVQEALDSYKKVIRFREKYLGKHHADTAVAYHDYAYFLYIIEQYDEALKYNEMAYQIDEELFSEHSITRMRSLNTRALIIWEQGKHKEADEIFDYIIKTSIQMSDDYLIDVADFSFNYARCLHDQGNNEGAKREYRRCIGIWTGVSDSSNRKLAMAYQELADCLFSEGDVAPALENYLKSADNITEDFYLMVDVLDSIGACQLLNQDVNQALEYFERLLRMLAEYHVTDSETKFQHCNNLLCILDAESEDEVEMRNLLIDRVKDSADVLEYVNNFFTELKGK